MKWVRYEAIVILRFSPQTNPFPIDSYRQMDGSRRRSRTDEDDDDVICLYFRAGCA